MTTNYYARVDYTFQGGDRIFTIPFDYIKEEHLNVIINDEICSLWAMLNTSQLEIDESVDLSVGDKITIVRTTPLDERMVVFSDTSILNKDNQNLAQEQVFDVVQEVYDSLNSHKQDVETLKPYIKTTVENIEHIITVDENIENINAVSESIDNVNVVAENETNISTLANNLTQINTVSNSISDINTVGNHINDVHTVSNNIDAVYDFAVETDMVNQSKGLITGNVSNNASVLETLKANAHSTFDLSKFTVVGSPTITDDGIASGFSSGNTITTAYSFKPNSQSWKIEGKFRTSNDITSSQMIFFTNTHGIRFFIFSNNLRLIIGSTEWGTDIWSNSSDMYAIQTNTEYEYSIEFTGTQYIYKVNGTTVNTKTNSNSFYQGTSDNYLLLGSANTTDFMQGSVDLKQFSIIVDGVPIFSGNKTGIDTIKPDNYTVVGTPTISANGIIKTTSGNLVKTPSITLGNNWDIIIPLKGETVRNAGAETLLRSEINHNYCSIGIAWKRMIIFFRDKDGNSISIDYPKINGSTVEQIANSTYLMKLSCRYDGTNYTIIAHASNDNGQTWGSGTPTVTTAVPYVAENSVSWEIDTWRMTADSEVNLNEFKIYVDGDLVYQPCLKIPYTMSKTGSKIVDSNYRSRVSDMYSQFGYAPYYTLSDTDFTLPMGEIYGMIEKNRYNGIVGQTIFSLDPLYHDNLHLLDGSLLYGNGIYKEFIENYIKPLYSKQPSRFVTESAWQTSVSSYGVCGYYVYDSENNTVRLPKVTGFVEGTLTASALGQLTEAGLPNITGSFTILGDDGNTYPHKDSSGSGAFSINKQSIGGATFENTGTGTDTRVTSISFNASRSSNIFNNSNTVQPQSIKGYMYIVVATGDTGYVPTNTSGIITDLNSKADKSEVDGQWVVPSRVTLASDVSWDSSSSEVSYSLSSFLPNDNYNYEVLFCTTGNTDSTSGHFIACTFQTDLLNNVVDIAQARTRTTSSVDCAGVAILPVGQGRYIKKGTSSSSNAGGTYTLYAVAYRRIGTNS